MLNPRFHDYVASFCSDNNTATRRLRGFVFWTIYIFKFVLEIRSIRSESELLDFRVDCFAGEPTIKQRFARHAKHYVNVEHSAERFESVYETWSTGIRVIPIKRPSVSSCIILSANKRGRVFFVVQLTRFSHKLSVGRAPLARSKTNRPLFTKLLVFRSGIVQRQTRVRRTPA